MPNEEFPIIYTFREPVAGAQFLAGVDMVAWGLAVRKGSDWIFEGVAPVGCGQPAPSIRDAYLSFLHRMRQDLYPRGGEALGEFKRRAASMMTMTAEMRQRWETAIEIANSSSALSDELHRMGRKKSSENPPSVSVVQLSESKSPAQVFQRDTVSTAA